MGARERTREREREREKERERDSQPTTRRPQLDLTFNGEQAAAAAVYDRPSRNDDVDSSDDDGHFAEVVMRSGSLRGDY